MHRVALNWEIASVTTSSGANGLKTVDVWYRVTAKDSKVRDQESEEVQVMAEKVINR